MRSGAARKDVGFNRNAIRVNVARFRSLRDSVNGAQHDINERQDAIRLRCDAIRERRDAIRERRDARKERQDKIRDQSFVIPDVPEAAGGFALGSVCTR